MVETTGPIISKSDYVMPCKNRNYNDVPKSIATKNHSMSTHSKKVPKFRENDYTTL